MPRCELRPTMDTKATAIDGNDKRVAVVLGDSPVRLWGLTPAERIERQLRAEGIQTNVPLHRTILDDPTFRQGGYDIHYLEHWIDARAARP